MNLQQPPVEKFIFVFNRYKMCENGAKLSNEICPTTEDFEVSYNDYDSLKINLQPKIHHLLRKIKADPILSGKEAYLNVINSLLAIIDHGTVEKFIINLINIVGVYLRGFGKVIFGGKEYLFKNKGIIKYQFNENIFSHKDDEPFEKIWAVREHDFRHHNHRFHNRESERITVELSRKIESFDDFYKAFKNYKFHKK